VGYCSDIEHQPTRLRREQAFYDASRNCSAVWCDMRVCGNRAKVRGFRERTRVND